MPHNTNTNTTPQPPTPESMAASELARELRRIRDRSIYFASFSSRAHWLARLTERARELGCYELACQGHRLLADRRGASLH